MNLKSDFLPRLFRWVFLILLYYVVCLVVLNTFMDRHGFRGYEDRYGFAKMMDYTAEKPFCYRALTPLIINGIMDVIPASALDRMQYDLLNGSEFLRYVDTTAGWNVEISARQHLTYFYLFLCLVLLIFATRQLTGMMLQGPSFAADLAPVLGMLVLPLSFTYGGQMYDFAELLFFTAAIIFILKNNWIGYYLILPLAAINKETAVCLVIYFAVLQFGRMSKVRYYFHLAIQSAVVAGIIIYIRLIVFAANPPPPVDYSLWDNLKFWTTPMTYIGHYEIYAPLFEVPRLSNIISIFMIWFIIAYDWKSKPAPVKGLLIFPSIFMIPIFLYFCHIDEVRNLAPLFPAFYLCAVHTVSSVYREIKVKE